MNFHDWQQLGPEAAARELGARVRTRLPPAQQQAAIAWLASPSQLEQQFAAASRGPLARVPFFAKDLFALAGMPMFAGSTFLPEALPTPESDGAFVSALRRAGAVPAGATHLHEFAYGITGENPHYGDCEHPRFRGRTTGGSSSGSAAVVAAGIVPLALGSDTGGSVRVPAAFCGLFGFRLQPRDPWISDAFPLAPSFDTPGWFTREAADMRMAIAALVGLRAGARPPRGCYVEFGPLDEDVVAACRTAAARFAPPAEPLVRAELLHAFAPALEAYHAIVAVEAWDAHVAWAERFRERYDPVLWQRLVRGIEISPAQHAHARAALAAIRGAWQAFFRDYDFLVLPATPSPALTKAECTLENRTRVLALTAPASIGGLPVLTIPVALPSGLTTGLQIVVNDVRSPAIAWTLEQAGAA